MQRDAVTPGPCVWKCAVWMLGLSILIVSSFFLDDEVRALALANTSEWLNWIARWISKFLDWPGLMVIALVCLVVARCTKSPAFAKLILAMIIASTLAGLLANVSRLTTGRTRPRADVQQGWYGPYYDGKLLIGRPKYNSFPSGHTATAVGFAGILLFTRRKFVLGLAINAAALMVGWSRIYLGAHHFSDVIVGAAIGALVARWIWLDWQNRLDRWAQWCIEKPLPWKKR